MQKMKYTTNWGHIWQIEGFDGMVRVEVLQRPDGSPTSRTRRVRAASSSDVTLPFDCDDRTACTLCQTGVPHTIALHERNIARVAAGAPSTVKLAGRP